MRIFPEMCASTLCPLSSATRNIALGSVSKTVPVTSMESCFGIVASERARFAPALKLAQNIRPVFGHRDRMFKMGREAPVLRHRRPAIFLDLNFIAAGVDHRLDGEDHPFFQAQP